MTQAPRWRDRHRRGAFPSAPAKLRGNPPRLMAVVGDDDAKWLASDDLRRAGECSRALIPTHVRQVHPTLQYMPAGGQHLRVRLGPPHGKHLAMQRCKPAGNTIASGKNSNQLITPEIVGVETVSRIKTDGARSDAISAQCNGDVAGVAGRVKQRDLMPVAGQFEIVNLRVLHAGKRVQRTRRDRLAVPQDRCA